MSEKNYMFVLGGEITHCSVYFSLPKSVCVSNGFSMEKIGDLGYHGAIYCNDKKMLDNCIFTNASKTEKPSVQIISDDFRSIIKPACNVEVKIIRDYNIFQWISFGALSLYRMIRRG